MHAYLFFAQLFWVALMELSPAQVRCLLQGIVPQSSTSGAVGYNTAASTGLVGSSYDTNSLQYGSISNANNSNNNCPSTATFRLHIMPPTAVALLSPDTSEILVFPDRCALSLPRYSSMRVLMQHLQPLLVVTRK